MPIMKNDQAHYIDNLINRVNQKPVAEASGLKYGQIMENKNSTNLRNSLNEAANADARARDMTKNIKETLLGECYNKVFTGALIKIMETSDFVVDPKKIVASYIQETGINNIMNDIRYKSVLLSEFHQMVEKYTDRILEECKDDTNCINFKVPADIRDDFYNDLDMTDTDDVVFQISDRVNDAIEEFINTNALNKLNIKQILQSTGEKLNDTKSDFTQESADRVAGREIHSIRNDGYVGIFSAMVESTAKSVMGNELLRESYMENTTLDMNKIVNSCKMSYAFMEMAQTLNLERINESYLLNYIKSL